MYVNRWFWLQACFITELWHCHIALISLSSAVEVKGLVKGLFYVKNNWLVLAMSNVVTNQCDFILWNKKGVLKSVGNQPILESIDFYCMDKNTLKTFWRISSFIFHRIKSHTGSLKQHGRVNDRFFIFHCNIIVRKGFVCHVLVWIPLVENMVYSFVLVKVCF